MYVIDSQQRFDSVQAALEFVKQHHHENTQAGAHGLQQFEAVAAQTNLVVLASHYQVCLRELNESGDMDANGRLSHIPRQASEAGPAEVPDRLSARDDQPW